MKTKIEDSFKEYCGYLINEYDKVKTGNGGRIMSDLKCFFEEGAIKDLIKKNSSNKNKIEILNIYAEKIKNYATFCGKKVEIKKFEEFS